VVGSSIREIVIMILAQERRNVTVSTSLVQRVRGEYMEMPGLCLTLAQAQRLWGLEPHLCDALLQALVDDRFLGRTDDGMFVLRATDT
jgi:hypothetical protein